MRPSAVLQVVIFVIGCAGSYMFIRWRRTRAVVDLEIALGLRLLEGEAQRAHDKAAENAR